MAKSGSKSLVNLASVVAIFIAIAVFAVQLLNQYLGLGIEGKILNIAIMVKDICLVLVVAICACSYAASLREGALKTLIYIFAVVFVVLAIVGIVLI